MSAPFRCGHCGRAIIAGDAYQCTRCSTLFHGICWTGNPRCTCSSSTSRVVHVGAGGTIEAGPPPRREPPRAAGRSSMRPSQAQSRARPSRDRRPPRSAMDDPAESLDLECPNCMLPIDSLDQPCPFCGHLPKTGSRMLVIDDAAGDAAPWGVQTIAILDKLFGLFVMSIAALFLIPFVAEGEIGFLVASMFWGSFGYLFWRIGTDLPKKKGWARTTQTVFSVLSLFGFPLGTVVGGLYLWGLHSEEADRFFDRRRSLPGRDTQMLLPDE